MFLEKLKKLLRALILPDQYQKSIFEIDLFALKKSGIIALFLDLDNTLVSRYEAEPSLKCQTWIREAREMGFIIIITSNSFYPQRVKKTADILNVQGFFMSAKPMPMVLERALEMLFLKKEQVVLIGDQVFTDLVGGNLLGIKTILVEPLAIKKNSLKNILYLIEKSLLKWLDNRKKVEEFNEYFTD